MRATSRLYDVSINTVTKLLVDIGTACAIYQNEVLRNFPCVRGQCDEIWSFCGMKEKNVPAEKLAVTLVTFTHIQPFARTQNCARLSASVVALRKTLKLL